VGLLKAELEVEFSNAGHARKALKIIKTKEFSDKASVFLSVSGSRLKARIEGKGFAALRARTTSFLRDLKAVFDAISLAEKK